MVDFVIPANDDAVRSVKVVIGALTNAIASVNGNEIFECVNETDQKKDQKKKEKVELKEEQKEDKTEIKEEKKEEKKEEVKEESKNLESMTLADLKAMAKEQGLKGYSTMKKADLIEALK